MIKLEVLNTETHVIWKEFIEELVLEKGSMWQILLLLSIFFRACPQPTMMIFNNTTSSPSTFLLTAFPGLELAHVWISIPVCCLYIIALLGNTMILFVIFVKQRLHKPMYYFLSMLSAADLCLTITTLPTVLRVLWFHARKSALKLASFKCSLYMLSPSWSPQCWQLWLLTASWLSVTHWNMPLSSKDMMILAIGLFICIRQLIFISMLLALKTISFQERKELSHPFYYHPDIIRDTYSNPGSTAFWACFFSSTWLVLT